MKGILEIKDELDEIMTEFMLDTNSENKVIEIQKKTSALFTSLEDNLCQKINKGDPTWTVLNVFPMQLL
jgi:hypothetical protein